MPNLTARCEATRKPLEDGTVAQCMKPKAKGDDHFCKTHRAKVESGELTTKGYLK